jgi:hypothetical protein
MITLMFVKAWFKWAAGTAVALFFEFALLREQNTWVLAGVVGATVLVFLGITTALVSDWKMQRRAGSSYRYNLVNDVTSERW